MVDFRCPALRNSLRVRKVRRRPESEEETYFPAVEEFFPLASADGMLATDVYAPRAIHLAVGSVPTPDPGAERRRLPNSVESRSLTATTQGQQPISKRSVEIASSGSEARTQTLKVLSVDAVRVTASGPHFPSQRGLSSCECARTDSSCDKQARGLTGRRVQRCALSVEAGRRRVDEQINSRHPERTLLLSPGPSVTHLSRRSTEHG